jgi:hypothetical protein
MNNLIEEYQLSDITLCDKIIEYFNNHNDKGDGEIFRDNKSQIDSKIKLSTDIKILPEDLHDNKFLSDYLKEVNNFYLEYSSKYEESTWLGETGIIEPISVQHYKPGEGYYAWHSERIGSNLDKTGTVFNRHLVFMTYLNSVNDQGGTEFKYQNIITKPIKGNTIIWPADWTYTHRGVPSPTENKYIITGWICLK